MLFNPKLNSQSRRTDKTQLCQIWSKDGNPWVKAPTAVTNYLLAISQLLLTNLLCFVSIAKYFLEQGQEAVPIFVSDSIPSEAFGIGEQFTPDLLEKHMSQAEGEFATELLGRRGTLPPEVYFPAGWSRLALSSAAESDRAREGNMYSVEVTAASPWKSCQLHECCQGWTS